MEEVLYFVMICIGLCMGIAFGTISFVLDFFERRF